MRIVLVLSCLGLVGCGGAVVSKQDIPGRYCGRTSADGLSRAGSRAPRRYELALSADGQYAVSTASGAAGPLGVAARGAYVIYGKGPVDRVEFKAICLREAPGGCGDYPAQVIGGWGGVSIMLEDSRGEPLELKTCG